MPEVRTVLDMSETNTSSGGLSLSSVLLVVFVVLKLTQVIDWSWWWVLSPLWIGFGLFLLIGVIAAWKTRR